MFAESADATKWANVVMAVGRRAGIPDDAMRELSEVTFRLFSAGATAEREALHGKPA